MPIKNYKSRIGREITKLREQEKQHKGERLFDRQSDEGAMGQIFAIVADGVADARPTHVTKRLFIEADLNPYDPYDWDWLISTLASIHYDNRLPQRPKVQDAAFTRKLAGHVRSILAGRTRIPNDLELAKLLLKRYSSEYPRIKTSSGAVALLRRHNARVKDIAQIGKVALTSDD